MGLNANKVKTANKDFVEQPQMEAGVYPGRTVQIIDLGLQPQRPYEGQDKAPAHEVMLTYELVDSFMVDENGDDIEDKPRWVSETFPFRSMKADNAKSTKRIKALDPNSEFEGQLDLMIDIPVNVTIVLNKSGDKVYTNVAGLSPMRPKDAAKTEPLKNPTKVFLLDNPDLEVFEKLPEWIREKIKNNLEFKGSRLEKLLGGEAKGEVTEKKEVKKVSKAAEVEPEFDEDDLPF